MNCDFRDNLTAYLDGELTGADAGAVRAHVENCAECRAYISLLKRSYDALESIESPEVSGGFAARVRTRTRPRTFARVRAFAALAAAAAVILALTARLNTTVNVAPPSGELDRIAIEVLAYFETGSVADTLDAVDSVDLLADFDGLDEQGLYGALEAVDAYGTGAFQATS